MQTAQDSQLVSSTMAASELGVARTTALVLLAQHGVPLQLVAGRYVIRRSDLDEVKRRRSAQSSLPATA